MSLRDLFSGLQEGVGARSLQHLAPLATRPWSQAPQVTGLSGTHRLVRPFGEKNAENPRRLTYFH
jgi:hypothetical protein